MKPTTVTPDDLFRPQRRYVIPLFQRGYVWNEVDHWGPLWRDIVVQTRKVQEADEHGGITDLQHHFLGAIVLEPKLTRIRHVADQAVIDGQQRLTTLQLVLVALRDALSDCKDPDVTRDLAMLTHNEGQWADDAERFKILPTNVGRSAWELVIEARSVLEVCKRFPVKKEKVKRKTRWVRQPLAQAYLYFRAQIDAYLHGGPGIVETEDDEEAAPISNQSQPSNTLDINRAKYLLEAISKYFNIVAIELETADDPQVIFETLNARMAPLTPADLIRNFVFIASTRRGLDTEQLYNTTWSAFDHDAGTPDDVPGFWRGYQKQGRRYLNRLDLFVFHYVAMRSGREIPLNRLFQAFRRWWEEGDLGPAGHIQQAKDGRDPKLELERMVNAAGSMRVLLEPSREQTTATSRFAQRLHTLDTTTPYPLLLYLFEIRDQLGPEGYEGAIVDLESYLIRRMLCMLTTKNYNQVMLRALGAMRSAPTPSRSALQQYLLGLEGDASRWPTNEETIKGVLLNPAYSAFGHARTQMVLQALERAHYTGKEEGIQVPWLSVEHVMPQHPNSLEDWPYPGGGQSPTLEEIQTRQNFRETLGNLTLVVQPLNSSLSNGPFRDKKKKLADESQLRMNRFFAHFSKDTWFEADIAERSLTLANLAVRIWPRGE